MIVVDISCPECGRTDAVQKMTLGKYRCMECEQVFTPADVRDD